MTQTTSVRCEGLFIIMLALPMAQMAVILPVLVRIIVVIVTAIVAAIVLRMWLAISRSHYYAKPVSLRLLWHQRE